MLLGVLISTPSCQPPRESALHKTTEQQALLEQRDSAADFQAARERGILAWRERDSREKVEEAISHYETATGCSPTEKELGAKKRAMVDVLLRLSEAHYFMGNAHMAFDERKESNRKDLRDRFEKGLTAAEQAMVLLDKDVADMLAGKEKSMGANVGAVPDEVLPALYWYAANLGEWSRHAGPRQAMLYRERVRIAMEVIQRRLPNYDNAGADRFLGIYHSRFPASGGDPKRSEEAFKQSLELSPNYFDTRFRYALHYAVLVQEREIFERQLRRVLETPATVVPELEPENKLAQEHARRLMAKADQLFF
jgi:tetratricopeptide (TPR) repeat protein